MQIPGYRLKSEIGRGGMANVYLAVQESFDRPVAIKVMNPALAADPTFSKRFIREAKLMAQLSHPHIVPVFDIGAHGNLHYMAMEHIAGGTLKQRLKDGMEMDDAAIERIVMEVAAALDHAGEQDIIHRDVKPDNIMFRADGSAVLMDFGIARPIQGDDAMTQMGTIVGTPKYMSPEQHRGKGVDARADLYSLGVVLFEMLAGRPPYTGEDAMSIGIKHISEPIPLLPGEKRRWQPLVKKLMAKDPEQRFQRGNEVIAALKALSSAAAAVVAGTAAAPAPVKFVDGNTSQIKLESRMRTRELKEKAGLMSSIYVFDIYVMADDFNQFQGHFQKISEELFNWGKERGKKCGKVKLKATVHPWIAGRVKEYVRNIRKADTHQFLQRIPIEVNLVGADGKPIEQYRIDPEAA